MRENLITISRKHKGFCSCSFSQFCLTLWDPHGLQHTRLSCPSPSPRACSNSCQLGRWCYPTISLPVISFSSCLRSFPSSGSFPMSQFFISCGESIGASASVLPVTTQDWFPLGMTDLIPLQSNGISRVFSSTTVQKHLFFDTQISLWFNSHPYMTTGKNIALTIQIFVGKVMSLLICCLCLSYLFFQGTSVF